MAAHREIASRLLLDPALVLRARGRLERWIRDGRIHPRWAEAWDRTLSLSLEKLAGVLSDPGSSDLRQTSPFAGELTARERWSIWKSVA